MDILVSGTYMPAWSSVIKQDLCMWNRHFWVRIGDGLLQIRDGIKCSQGEAPHNSILRLIACVSKSLSRNDTWTREVSWLMLCHRGKYHHGLHTTGSDLQEGCSLTYRDLFAYYGECTNTESRYFTSSDHVCVSRLAVMTEWWRWREQWNTHSTKYLKMHVSTGYII